MADYIRTGRPVPNSGALDSRLVWGDLLAAHPEWTALATSNYFLNAAGLAVPVSVAQPFPVGSGAIVQSANNSTTTPLAASATFTGTADNISTFNQVNLTLFGRPNVAVSGDATDAKGSLFFEFSPDGTNWDISVPIVVRTLGVFIPYPLINVGGFYRTRYLNDGGAAAISILGTGETAGTPTNQTVFRLQSYLLPLATKELARTLDQSLSGSDPISLVRSVSTGRDTNGIFVNAPGAGVNNANSSTTLLGGNATFTAANYMDLSGYTGVSVAVNTDQNGTLLIDYSEDASTIDQTLQIPISGGAPFFTGVTPLTRYMRIRYTNGSIAQTRFRLQTVVKLTALASTPDQISSATLNAAGQTVQVNTTQGFAAIAMYFNPTSFVGTLVFESTTDGVNWIARTARQSGQNNVFLTSLSGSVAVPIDATKDYRSNAAGFTAFRVRVSAYTSGSVVATVEASIGAGPIESIAPVTIAPTTGVFFNIQTATSSSSQVSTSSPVGRKSIEFHSRADNNTTQGSTVTPTYIYIGTSNPVTSANGRQIQPGEGWTLEVSEGVGPFFMITTNAAGAASATLDVTEVSG